MSENGDNTKILVVDDESVITLQISKMLTKAGYDVVGTAADGEEAIQLAIKSRPDIIILDIVMPRVHGLAAIPKIKHWLPDSTIIVLTALQSKKILNEAMDAGAKDYIYKPYNKRDMLDMVKKYAN